MKKLWKKVELSGPALSSMGYFNIVKYLKEGEEIPSWCGIAWWGRESRRDMQYAVVMPIPLNFVAGLVHAVWTWTYWLFKLPPWRFVPQMKQTDVELNSIRRDMERTCEYILLLERRLRETTEKLEDQVHLFPLNLEDEDYDS